jgi:peptide-methionine (S)-S-oxide reductase
MKTRFAFLLITALLTATLHAQRATAIFAGGCFWCMEPPFEKLKGVVSVVSGYTGGVTKNPTYEEVSDGGTGHYEAVLVTYDPKQVSYATLLDVFWHNIDPLDASGQFCDKGGQYRAAIFYRNPAERQLAEQTKQKIAQAKRWNIATQILPATPFYLAEGYHQDYAKKNPVRYKFYRFNCGRDHRLEQLWGK